MPSPRRVAAGHRDAELLLGGVRRELADDPALVDDEHAVRERRGSPRARARRAARRGPAARCSSRRRCTNSIAPTSRPRVGCAAIVTFGSSASSRAITHFCWLPPESEEASVCGSPPRTSYCSSSGLARLLHPPRGEHPPARLALVLAQGEVLGEREVEDEAAPVAVLGDVADAGAQRALDAAARDLGPVDRDRAALGLAQAGDRLDQLGLAVAVDAGHADDLAGAHLQREAVDGGQARGRRARAGRRSSSSGAPALRSSFSSRNSTSRPTISFASDASVAPSVATVSIFLPRRSTVTRSAMSSTSRSLCEMKITDVLSAVRRRSTLNRSCVSWAVSTAVGSSRMRTSASR